MPDFKILTDSDYAAALTDMQQGIILVHKELCPHCKNMMKVLDRFSAFAPEATLALVDSETELNIKATLGAERVPAVAVVKDGKVKLVKAGLMNPQELLALYHKA